MPPCLRAIFWFFCQAAIVQTKRQETVPVTIYSTYFNSTNFNSTNLLPYRDISLFSLCQQSQQSQIEFPWHVSNTFGQHQTHLDSKDSHHSHYSACQVGYFVLFLFSDIKKLTNKCCLLTDSEKRSNTVNSAVTSTDKQQHQVTKSTSFNFHGIVIHQSKFVFWQMQSAENW